MKTSVNATIAATAGYGPGTGATVAFFRPLNGQADNLGAAQSALYRTYCNLYEECKMIGCKVSLAVVSAVGGTDIPSLQIYTAWDRKHGCGEPEFTAGDIKNAATSNVATALNNNVAKLTRSCYASDLMEKATWFDASLDAGNNNRNSAWVAAGLNPNMFCPSFFFYLNCPSKGATTSVSLSISVTYYFAFRNPRYGGAGDAKMMNLGPRPFDNLDGDGGDDMDDGGDMVEHEDIDDQPDMDADSPPAAAEAAAAPSKRSSVVVVQSPAKKSRPLNK